MAYGPHWFLRESTTGPVAVVSALVAPSVASMHCARTAHGLPTHHARQPASVPTVLGRRMARGARGGSSILNAHGM